MVDLWTLPIRLDPKWNKGDYYGKDEPLDGLAQALTIVTATTRHYGWADKTFGYKWADPARDPASSIDNRFAIEDTLVKGGAARARSTDANSMIYTARANQLFHLTDAEVKGMKAKILVIPARSDLVFPPVLSERAAARYRAQGGVAEVVVLEGEGGHLDGVFAIAGQGEAIRAFLAR
jgi:homoserine O-acetyltransferase